MKPLRIYSCLIVEEDSNLWHQQFTRTLRTMGHRVFVPPPIGLRSSWARLHAGLWREPDAQTITGRILEDVGRVASREGTDVFFCYLYPFQFVPELLKSLTRRGIPCVYFFCDNFSHPELANDYAPHATLNWVPEKEALPFFQASGSRAVHLPMAANPEIYRPVAVEETPSVTFVGTKNPYRRERIGRLLTAGIPVRVFGDGWNSKNASYHSLEARINGASGRRSLADRIRAYAWWKKSALIRFTNHGIAPWVRSRRYAALGREFEALTSDAAGTDVLDREALNRRYSESAVSLGINDQFIPERTENDGIAIYSKLRDFEATMAGACYLTQRTPENAEHFEDGQEIMTYATPEELVEKARFLLANETFRKRLRKAGHRRALAEHTWSHRFEKILSLLKP